MSVEFPVSTGITLHHDTYPFISPSKFAGSIKGKVILITGASRGIGRATALGFAAAGAHVAALARTSTDINSLAAEIKSKYDLPTLAITGDVLHDPCQIIAKTEAALGPIDILINCAGINRVSRFTEEPNVDIWWKVMEVNVKAPIAMIHAVLPSFLKRGKGIIITLGSAAADLPLGFMSSYNASKAAVQKAIQILDMELQPQGIYNYVLHPGNIKTELSAGESVTNGKDMRDLMDAYLPFMTDTERLPADSMVALAVLTEGEGRAKLLSGRYWDVQDDLEEILEERERIDREGLYQLRIRKL